MKVNLINEIKDEYKMALSQHFVQPDSLFRICIREWQQYFSIDEMYLEPVLKKALKNEISGRYWGGELNSIKSSLLTLAKHNPDLFWTALKDLFNEDRMLIMRANRFIHHCDMIFDDYRKTHKKENTHRQNYYSASLLLSLQYPENYCLFEYGIFEHFCKRIEVNHLPVDTDLERYYKIMRATYKIITKDEEMMNLYYQQLEPEVYFGPSLDVVRDLMTFSAAQ